ncbi:MAG: hypothetical protein QXU99_05025 [Candidatus Bathyarchaeia archaeon]
MKRMNRTKANTKGIAYTNVKSQFIKSKIQGANWKWTAYRNYIDKLITIENYVLHGATGFAHALYMHQLKEQYKTEYEIIFHELKPKEYKHFKEEERKRQLKHREEEAKRQKQLAKKEEHLRRQWLKAGGIDY